MHDGRVHNYQSGCRYGANPQLKPGMASRYLAIADHLQLATRYDFLVRRLPVQKEPWGTHADEVIWAIVRRQRTQFQTEEVLRRLKRRLVPGRTR